MEHNPNQALGLKSLAFWLSSMGDERSMMRRYWNARDYEGFMKLNQGTCPWCGNGLYFDTFDKEGKPKVVNGLTIDRVMCYCFTLKHVSDRATHWYESSYRNSYLGELTPIPYPNKAAEEQTKKILTSLGKFLINPTRSALIHGKTGTGKTHMLQSIKTAFGSLAVYITFTDLFDKLMGYVKSDQGKIGELTDYLRFAPVLLLDDYGLQYKTSWTLDVVASVINYRYELRRYAPTIMTTNRSWAEILSLVNNDTGIDNEQRIFSRMIDSEVCTVMTVEQDDYRNKVNLKEAGLYKKAGVK